MKQTLSASPPLQLLSSKICPPTSVSPSRTLRPKTLTPFQASAWLLIPKQMADKSKGAALKAFLIWGLTDGQNLTEPLSYSRVPQSVLEKELVAVKQLQY